MIRRSSDNERGSRTLFIRLAAAAAVLVIASVAARAEVPVSSPANPALPMPADFAPAPFALPGSRPATEKQLASHLQRLEPIASADVLISGQAPAVAAAIVLRPRPGRALTPQLVQYVATLALQAVPGVAPQALTIADSKGYLWYSRGSVQAPPTNRSAGPPALLWVAAVLVLAGLGAGVGLRSTRRAGPAGAAAAGAGALSRLDDERLTRLARDERPEIRGLLLSQLPEKQAARLRRVWHRAGLEAPAPFVSPDQQVVQTVLQALQSRVP